MSSSQEEAQVANQTKELDLKKESETKQPTQEELRKQLEEMTYREVAIKQASQITSENPLDFTPLMYKTVNPLAVKLALSDARALLKKENKKSDREYNVYMTIGSEYSSERLFDGLIGAMLFFEDYLDIAADRKKLDKKDVETAKKVFRSIDLPTRADANTNCRHYALLIESFLTWLSTGFTQSPIKGDMRNNYEMVRFLRAMAFEQFPAIPPAIYYVGTVKNDNPMRLAERMHSVFDFTKYMSKISVELNDPKFVVTTANAPLVLQAGHPLSNLFLGEDKDGETTWLGVFLETEEFGRICLENGIPVKDVKRYMIENTMESHIKNVHKNNKIAKFIESQNLAKSIFEQRIKNYSVEKIDEDEIDKLLS